MALSTNLFEDGGVNVSEGGGKGIGTQLLGFGSEGYL